eukprot:2121821-Pyramimonas_sp.AAC.1
MLKFATPTVEVDDAKKFCGGLNIHHAVRARRQLSALKCPMGGSVTYKRTSSKRKKGGDGDNADDEGEAKAPAVADEAATAPQAKGKARAKGKAKANAAKFKIEEKLVDTVTTVTSATGSRGKLWLDDLFAAVLAPLQSIHERNYDKKAMSDILCDGLKFATNGEISLNGKALKSAGRGLPPRHLPPPELQLRGPGVKGVRGR